MQYLPLHYLAFAKPIYPLFYMILYNLKNLTTFYSFFLDAEKFKTLKINIKGCSQLSGQKKINFKFFNNENIN